MKWVSAVSERPVFEDALDEAASDLTAGLGRSRPDLTLAFVSPQHGGRYGDLPRLLADRLGDGPVIGCSAGGVIGAAREIEGRPGLSLTAAILPDVVIHPFRLQRDSMPVDESDAAAWCRIIGVPPGGRPHFLLFPDPFSFDTEALIRGLDLAYPGSVKIGGLASGGAEAGANALFSGRAAPQQSGAVGVALCGNVEVDTIVAQGCRPIGEPMFVTRCHRNIVWQLDGGSPLEVLRSLHDRLDERDRKLFRHSLFLGIAMNESRQEYRHGDFLIRNVVGADSDSGAIAIGGMLNENCIVQFHLRDARTSAEDLENLLRQYRQERGDGRVSGALLFSCLGRGEGLYGEPDHDTRLLRKHLGDLPVGGFFCNGEIGPIHGTTFLHGYTGAFALFRAPGE